MWKNRFLETDASKTSLEMTMSESFDKIERIKNECFSNSLEGDFYVLEFKFICFGFDFFL